MVRNAKLARNCEVRERWSIFAATSCAILIQSNQVNRLTYLVRNAGQERPNAMKRGIDMVSVFEPTAIVLSLTTPSGHTHKPSPSNPEKSADSKVTMDSTTPQTPVFTELRMLILRLTRLVRKSSHRRPSAPASRHRDSLFQNTKLPWTETTQSAPGFKTESFVIDKQAWRLRYLWNCGVRENE